MNCHPERSEGPVFPACGRKQVLRFAQDDSFFKMTIHKWIEDDSTPCLRARMMFRIHTLQTIQRDVSIDLCCRNVGVAEDRLHCSQVSAVLDHVRCARVPQHVRTGGTSRRERSLANHLPHPLTSQAARPSAQKQQRRTLLLSQYFPASLQILL